MAKPTKVSLTKRGIEMLGTPPKLVAIYDSQIPHLAICVTPTGAKAFYRIGTVRGMPTRIKLGGFPQMTVPQARKTCSEMNVEILNGGDPAADRKAIRRESTFGSLFDWYLEYHSKPHKKTWHRDLRRFENHLAHWRGRKLSRITRADVAQLHVKIGTKAPGAANQVLELVRHMFVKAIDDHGYTGANPARGVKRFRMNERERFLTSDEMPRFFAAVNELQRLTTKHFIFVSLFTGVRRNNVCEMRWDEIDMRAATWTIPGIKSKSGVPMVIALVPMVIEILELRKEQVGKCQWVFPGQGKTGHLADPKAAWKKVCKDAGLEDLRLHDLRRTLGSWQAAAGSSLQIIGKSLGHKSLASTQVYARLNLDPVRESVTAAVAAIQHAAEK